MPKDVFDLAQVLVLAESVCLFGVCFMNHPLEQKSHHNGDNESPNICSLLLLFPATIDVRGRSDFFGLFLKLICFNLLQKSHHNGDNESPNICSAPFQPP